MDLREPADGAAVTALRLLHGAEQRRDTGQPELTPGEEQEFATRLHTWLHDEHRHRRHYLADLGGLPVGTAGMLYRRMPKPGASPGSGATSATCSSRPNTATPVSATAC